MLLIILFWVALIAGVLGFIGAVAEHGGQINWATLTLFAVALIAAIGDRSAWL